MLTIGGMLSFYGLSPHAFGIDGLSTYAHCHVASIADRPHLGRIFVL